MGQVTFIIILIALTALAWFGLSRYKSRSSAYQQGFRPKNVTPWGQFLRLWQADHGKGDNWFTRPIIKSENGRMEWFPKPHEPGDDQGSSDPQP